MVFLRLAGKTGDQGGAQADVRNLLSKKSDDVFQLFFIRTPSHPPEYIIGSMLNRHINIMQDLRIPADRLHKFGSDFLGIAIEETDPADPVNLRQSVKQFREHLFAVEIRTVNRCLLGNQDQFTYSLRGELPCCTDHALHGKAPIAAPD